MIKGRRKTGLDTILVPFPAEKKTEIVNYVAPQGQKFDEIQLNYVTAVFSLYCQKME